MTPEQLKALDTLHNVMTEALTDRTFIDVSEGLISLCGAFGVGGLLCAVIGEACVVIDRLGGAPLSTVNHMRQAANWLEALKNTHREDW